MSALGWESESRTKPSGAELIHVPLKPVLANVGVLELRCSQRRSLGSRPGNCMLLHFVPIYVSTPLAPSLALVFDSALVAFILGIAVAILDTSRILPRGRGHPL